MLRKVCVITTLIVSLAVAVVAQSRDRGFRRSADASCSDGWNDRRASHCEIREDTIGGANPLDIDAGPNGGIHIRGWDRGDVLVRSKIIGYARTDAHPRAIVSRVRIETAGGRGPPSGPTTDPPEHRAPTFDVPVPRT